MSPFSPNFIGQTFLYFFSEWVFICIFAFFMKLKRKSWLDAFLIFFFLYLATRAMRHIALAMIFLLPAVGEEITSFIHYCKKKWDISRLRTSTKLIFSLCLLYAICHIAINGLSPGKGWKVCRASMSMGEDMPVEAVHYLLKNNLPGEIFNSYDYGPYLNYRLYLFFFHNHRIGKLQKGSTAIDNGINFRA